MTITEPQATTPGRRPHLFIRLARPDDVPALRRIYAGAVRALAPGHYSPAQIAAWAGFAGTDEFPAFILGVDTFVAQLGGRVDGVPGAVPAGFCGIAADGHIASVYVAPGQARRGLGTALLEHALAAHPRPASGRWYAEASRLSLPLFLHRGFDEVGTERSERAGVAFERHLVERRSS